MSIDLLFPGILGLLVGGILSYMFNIYSKPTANKFTYLIFGVKSDMLIKMILFFVVTSGIAGLAGLSTLIRDFQYPLKNPYDFSVEMLVASFFPALLLLVMTYLRDSSFTTYTLIDFFLLSFKFGILHLLLQFSGVYSSIFPMKS